MKIEDTSNYYPKNDFFARSDIKPEALFSKENLANYISPKWTKK